MIFLSFSLTSYIFFIPADSELALVVVAKSIPPAIILLLVSILALLILVVLPLLLAFLGPFVSVGRILSVAILIFRLIKVVLRLSISADPSQTMNVCLQRKLRLACALSSSNKIAHYWN